MLMVLNDDVFPENLRYQRKKKKMSQYELSMQTGIDAFFIKSMEAGRCRCQMPSDQYILLCQVLKVDPVALNSPTFREQKIG